MIRRFNHKDLPREMEECSNGFGVCVVVWQY